MAFPLSTIHYIENSKITNPVQRQAVARTMALVSHCTTLRARRVLLRYQMLDAMHRAFGRPAFRPARPEVLGTGVRWAFEGEHGPLVLRGPRGLVDAGVISGMTELLRKANQYIELQMLGGPSDSEIPALRQRGYRPEAARAVGASRLDWERTFAGTLTDDPVSRAELRVRLQARELTHEHLDLYAELTAEYGIRLRREVGHDPARPNAARKQMIAFADDMPSMRIAVDLKTELFRNASKAWKQSAIYDIDALSVAVPYCHVVVPDGEMADLLTRSGAGPRHGTKVLSRLTELPGALDDLVQQVDAANSDLTGWDWAGPWDGYCLEWAELLACIRPRPAA